MPFAATGSSSSSVYIVQVEKKKDEHFVRASGILFVPIFSLFARMSLMSLFVTSRCWHVHTIAPSKVVFRKKPTLLFLYREKSRGKLSSNRNKLRFAYFNVVVKYPLPTYQQFSFPLLNGTRIGRRKWATTFSVLLFIPTMRVRQQVEKQQQSVIDRRTREKISGRLDMAETVTKYK